MFMLMSPVFHTSSSFKLSCHVIDSKVIVRPSSPNLKKTSAYVRHTSRLGSCTLDKYVVCTCRIVMLASGHAIEDKYLLDALTVVITA